MPPDNRREDVPAKDEYLPHDPSQEIRRAEEEVAAFLDGTEWIRRSRYLNAVEEQNLRALREGRQEKVIPAGMTPKQPCPALEPVRKGVSERALSIVEPRPATAQIARGAASRVENIIKMPVWASQRGAGTEARAGKKPLIFPAKVPELTREVADEAAHEALRHIEKIATFKKPESVDRFLDEVIGETVILDTALQLEKRGIKVDHEASRAIVKQYITTRFRIA